MQSQIEELIEETNFESLQEMREKWVKVLSSLWVPFGKVPTPEQLGMYQELLKQVPLGLLELSINRTIREHRYASVPTIGNVWDALLKELDLGPGMSVDDAIERWCAKQLESIIFRFVVS